MIEEERKHSKYSASGAERWLACPGSVSLEEKSPPSKDSFWSKEGTEAHAVLEDILLNRTIANSVPKDMLAYTMQAAQKIWEIQDRSGRGAKLLVERRVFASFLHPEMFGTCDAIIPGLKKRVLHIIDFKYGAGHVVSPKENKQLIQYALSVADSYDWERSFDVAYLWILQPRAGLKWASHWRVSIKDLRTRWAPLWAEGVRRVEGEPVKLLEGAHCHWCRARFHNCPLKLDIRRETSLSLFEANPLTDEEINGIEKESKAETKGRKNRREEKDGEEKIAGEESSEDFF